jgi:hypothetical protein
MIEVTKTDANNYCLVLRALGMEEDGDPVAEIERLKAVSKQPSTINIIPRMDDSLICRLLNVRIIGAGRLPKEDLQTIDDAVEAIKAATQPSEVEKFMDAAGLCKRCAAPLDLVPR